MNNKAGKPTAFLLISSGFAFRNYITSGIADDLKEICQLKIYFPKSFEKEIRQLNLNKFQIDFIPEFKISKFFKFLNGILSKATNLRLGIYDKHFEKWHILISKKREKIPLYAQYLLAKIFCNEKLYKVGRKIEKNYIDKIIEINFKDFFKNVNNRLIISTQPYKLDEALFLYISKMKKIKSIGAVLSWDNLLWMGHIISEPEYFLVWGEEMKNDLKIHYPYIENERIFEVSSPQFDFHLADENIWAKEKFLKYYGIKNNSKIIFYAGNTYKHFRSEPLLVEKIIEEIFIKEYKDEITLIVRPHPHDKAMRFDYLKEKYSNVLIQRPFQNTSSSPIWFIPEKKELEIFSSSLKHSDIVINMASTITLDAFFFNKPVINIAFSPVKDDPFSIRVPYYYHSPHYKKVANSNAADIVYSMEELRKHLRLNLENPELKASQRAETIRKICGFGDKLSKEKILGAIEKVLK